MPKFAVKVIPGAKKNLIKEENQGLKVYLTAPAVDGKANSALIVVLARYWGLKKNRIQILSGLKSRQKVIEIVE